MHQVETAYDANKWLTGFFPIVGLYAGPTVPMTAELDAGANMIAPHSLVQWNKPVLVLHDELSGSGGDVFPDLLQAGGAAKTFGARTMGLGGSVEPVITLPYSQAQLHLTRGLMGPYNPSGDPKLIENEGVTPNYPYAHTIADFRAGYVGYVKAFSQVATTITR
jgi:C-terminal processing protease CtpA/Prc